MPCPIVRRAGADDTEPAAMVTVRIGTASAFGGGHAASAGGNRRSTAPVGRKRPCNLKEIDVSCVSAHDPQLARLADAIAQRVGLQRFHVWFSNSTKLDLKNDGLEIAVPNDFISEWIGRNFASTIQEAANEVLGCAVPVRFSVVPQLFELGSCSESARGVHGREAATGRPGASPGNGGLPAQPVADHDRVSGPRSSGRASPPQGQQVPGMGPHNDLRAVHAAEARPFWGVSSASRLRHSLEDFVVGPSNQLAYDAALHVADFPGSQYNPLFVHGSCGLGKTHLLQGLCRRFAQNHPAKRWMYLTGEEFTNEFLSALRHSRLDGFRRKVRDLDLLVIDDVHFLSGKRATQEEFLHTFNAIEAMGRQVVMASDNHPKLIAEFSESLINRFVSGMVVRIDPPNFATRCDILRSLLTRAGHEVADEVISWIARRVTQNVRELEGAVTRIAAHARLADQVPDMTLVQEALCDLDRQQLAPVKPDNVLQAVCSYFALDMRDLLSGRRQRTISLARSLAMYLIRKTSKLSFPEIGMRLGKRNHSTVISACRRVQQAADRNENLTWTTSVGTRSEEAAELIERLEDLSRTMS